MFGQAHSTPAPFLQITRIDADADGDLEEEGGDARSSKHKPDSKKSSRRRLQTRGAECSSVERKGVNEPLLESRSVLGLHGR